MTLRPSVLVLGCWVAALVLLVSRSALAQLAPPPSNATLEKQLLAEDPATLVRAAREQGDPDRGALVFHQAHLACTKCHHAKPGEKPIGPDLTRTNAAAKPAERLTDAQILEAVINPSKAVRAGYETVSVVTDKGTVLTGLLVEERPDALVLRDSSRDFQTVVLPKSQIDERAAKPVSLMPTGLANQLANRQQFLDLACYLLEIVEKGPARERELRPIAALYALPPLPEYESRIDHARLIGSADTKSIERGAAIYGRLCVNCHGTKDAPGSLPTSLRFASGVFKNGSDPLSMYRTLTHGYGMMTAQRWMVPKQKYDVIHYIREEYLKKSNPSQLVAVDAAYLERLPKGDTLGPEPSRLEAWATMNYGPSLIGTYEVGKDGTNFAHKGIAMQMGKDHPHGVAQAGVWQLFDHDTLRLAAAWGAAENSVGFIDWKGINFNGAHQVHPRLDGVVQLANPTGPGWANPENGSFEDPRLRGRDGRPYGPLPKNWGNYRGLYHAGAQTIIAYQVGATDILELPAWQTAKPHDDIWLRHLKIGRRPKPLVMQVARHPQRSARLEKGPEGSEVAVLAGSTGRVLVAGLVRPVAGSQWLASDTGDLRLQIPAGEEELQLSVWTSQPLREDVPALVKGLDLPAPPELTALVKGGPARWTEVLKTDPIVDSSDAPFAVDVLPLPTKNPWSCQIRPTGLDFVNGGKQMAVCTWDGDVWLLDGIEDLAGQVTWKRIASGLFQPLGLKVVGGAIYVGCRDQIVVLRDLNGDGETDYYESFNHDHQVTEHFHEFAMGLQTDAAGNFYYAKSARHALKAVVPHHGTLLKVSADGAKTDILATGFRAANGVCLNPDGSFVVTDQEGHWNPKNRINWVTPGGFYGNMFGYHDVTDAADSAMQPPLCWVTNAMDRSPAELLWVDSKKWGPLDGSLLNLSYGNGRVFVVPHEKVDGVMQGGVSPLPIGLFPTGLVRGRFHPTNGQLYACGMFAWAGNQTEPGGLYRIRYTGKPVWLPVGLKATKSGLAITFSEKLSAESTLDPQAFSVKSWSLVRSANYGSSHKNERPLAIEGASLAADGKTVIVKIPEIAPTWCMEIRYKLRGADGQRVEGVIHNTIHKLGE